MCRTRVCLLILATLVAFTSPFLAQAPPPDGWVVLPVEEYRALRDRTLPQPAGAAAVASTLTRIDYDLRAEGDAIAGRALLTLDVLRDGWARVQIPAGLMVRAATLDGASVSIVRNPAPHVLLERAGRFALALDVVLPLARNAGTDSISLPASSAPVSRVSLVLPRGGIDLTVTGGFIADRSEDAGQSRWTVFGQPNAPVVLAWKRKADDRRSEAPLRTRARIIHVVGLAEDAGSQFAASVRVEVVQGLLAEVTLLVPPGLIVNRVDGVTVDDWQLSGTELRVRLLEPVAAEVAFVVLAEMTVAREGTLDVPLVRMPAAERETGGIAVDVVGAGEIAGRTSRGLDAADPADLGDIVSGRESPSMLAFRLRPLAGNSPRSLTVNVVRYAPQAVLVANVEQARYRMLAAEDGRLLVEAKYVVRNNQRSFLKVTLPPASSVWSAAVAGRPARPGGAEGTALLLPLDKGRSGEEAPSVLVSIVYLQQTSVWPDKGATRIELPAVDLPISSIVVQLRHSPRFRVTLEPGSFRPTGDPGRLVEPPSRAVATTGLPPASPDRDFAALIDQLRSDTGLRTVSGALPVSVAVPDLGPSLFLASELTAEGARPAVDLRIKRTKR